MFYSSTVLVAILAGANGFTMTKAPTRMSTLKMQAPLDFLEANPYYDQSTIPLQTFKAAAPHIGKVVSVKRIVGPNAVGETCDIVIDHGGKMPYWEGQSYGVVPPGTNPKNGKPYTNRLYSIASTRYGDDMKGTTTTLCVRRATYWCPELKADDPAKKGVCSNFLCDTKPGDDVMMTGPAGKVMLMPEKNPNTDLIMVATGTGIAPYRSFLRRLFFEQTPAAANYKGLAWMFLGVAGTENLLYDADWQQTKQKFPNNFRLDYALSREMTNKAGGKMYIQDKVEEYADEVFTRMDKGAHMYFCGLKGMMPGILTMFEGVCAKKGIVWADKLKHWKEEGQWHVEVY
jgi:ferredoxin--NADP+ reductase